jgi:hypothetical protein
VYLQWPVSSEACSSRTCTLYSFYCGMHHQNLQLLESSLDYIFCGLRPVLLWPESTLACILGGLYLLCAVSYEAFLLWPVSAVACIIVA